MNYFTDDNTEGYDATDLDAMNADLERRASSIDEGDTYRDDQLQHLAEQVQADYDSANSIKITDNGDLIDAIGDAAATAINASDVEPSEVA